MLQPVGHPKQFFFCDPGCRNDIRYLWLPAGDRPSLVKCHDLHLACFFQGNGGLEHDPVLRSHSISYHDRYRRRQAQRARAADYQYRDSSCQCKSYTLSRNQPYQDGYHRYAYYRRHENAGYPVCHLGNRRFGGCRVADHLNDLGKGRILPHPGGLAPKKSRMIQGCRRHRVSHFLVHRYALPGQRRFIDRAAAIQHDAIHGNILAWPYYKDVSLSHLVYGYFCLHAVSDDRRSLRRQLHQTLERIRRPPFGTGFQHLSYGDQRQDHCCGFKIEFMHVIHYLCHVAMHLGIRHRE